MLSKVAVALLFVFFISPASAFAQASPTPTATSASYRNQRKEAIDDMRTAKASARAEFKNTMEEKRREFKERMENIKDEKKREITQNVVERIASVNEKWISHWQKVLERLGEILGKIETRTAEAKAAGKTVTSVEDAIAKAKTAIGTAQTAVDTQANQTYGVTTTEETRLGEDVSGVLNEFHSDLRATQKTIADARTAVHAALRALKAVLGEPMPSPLPNI